MEYNLKYTKYTIHKYQFENKENKEKQTKFQKRNKCFVFAPNLPDRCLVSLGLQINPKNYNSIILKKLFDFLGLISK